MALGGSVSATRHTLEGDFSTDQKQVVGNLPGSLLFGINGATFYPHVSEDGWISWTNDRNLPNPEPVQIRGTVDEETVRQLIEEYLTDNVTDKVTEGDRRPITSGAVYDEFSKAVALLRTV